MTEKKYDVVIVGAGISGAILAKTISKAGYKVLMLEAGLDQGMELDSQKAYLNYQSYLNTYYNANAKVPNSPYPDLLNAPSPNVLQYNQITGNIPDTSGYFVQKGPLPFASDYTRTPGGTTLHWLGTCLRMLPNDFRLKSAYGHGVDWPISYDDLKPYYEMAEYEIGVSANVEEQKYPGTNENFFGKDYVFPMKKIPQSYLDKYFNRHLKNTSIILDNQEYPLYVTSTPQGRNSIPNDSYKLSGPKWDSEKSRLALQYSESTSYDPVGSIWDPYTGQRCEGNSSCVPICPVQAKYNALKTIKSANRKNLDIITQAVASKIEVDSTTGRITGVTYKKYPDPNSAQYTTEVARGTIYVVAAHSVETAKLLLASGVGNSSDQVGRNLMDHMVMLVWGLMPEKIFGFRGPGSSSNIPVFRDGAFRSQHSAFIMPIDNWGWNWPTGAPSSSLSDAVVNKNLFGKKLRNYINDTVTRQFNLHFEFEQLPEATNRVTIDTSYMDRLGNYRPVIEYNVSNYTRSAFVTAQDIKTQIFAKMGVYDFTKYNTTDSDYFTYENTGYSFYGAGHLVGTHRMGFTKADSVVNREQRTWDHENLYLVGCGNMPTLGTSNPTLTMAALAFWGAENIIKALK